ncbi:MAG: T9SS type A sorting domain-containing protein [Saprospiraceae bacterium]|nr:T9SS type A sorting domain-containing protein [Saprospiraceae bacterium]
MKSYFILLFILSLSFVGTSQCTYIIDMQDSFGDGWNGGSLDVSVNGSFYNNYTLSSGSSGQASFGVNPLDVVTFSYNSGFYDSEVTYQISTGGSQIYSDGPYPTIGLAFTHQCGGCDPPGNLNATNITTSTANLTWTATGTAYIVEYGIQGFSPGSGTVVATTNNPYNVTGLSPSTSYQYYVQQICSTGDTSVQGGPFTFATACAVVTAPWGENFFNSSTPNCWTESGSEAWKYSTAAGYSAGNAGDHTGNNGNYAWIDGSTPSGPSQISTLTSPFIDISALATPLLSYWLYSHNGNGTGYNTMLCEFYDGASWNTINTVNSDQTDNWVNFSFGLQNFTITGPVQIRFTITENSTGSPFYNDILIDDIEIKDAPNVSASEIIGLQQNYCNSSVDIDLVIKNMSGNAESDVPWAVESNGSVIDGGSISILGAYASDTISLVLGGVGPSGTNASIIAYTYLPADLTPSDDTITGSLGMSYTGINTTMSSPVGCVGDSTGSIISNGHSGISPYSYIWAANANNQTGSTATGLSAGTYSVTVTDSIGCAISTSLTLLDPPSTISVSDSTSNILCTGGSTGWSLILPSGGVPPYNYLWSNGQASNPLTNVGANTYTATVTDSYGCEDSISVTLTEPSLALTGSITDNADGTLTANASGGTGAYSYLWDPATGNQTTATATGLTSGNYYVVISDSNGCTELVTIQVTIVNNYNISNVQNLNIFPNPTSGNVFIEINLKESSDINLRLSNITGKEILTRSYLNKQSEKIQLETTQLPTGIYMVYFTIGAENFCEKLIITK